MKRPWYEHALFASCMTLALTLVVLILVTGITNLVTALSIVFIGVGGFYLGTSVERQRIYNERRKVGIEA